MYILPSGSGFKREKPFLRSILHADWGTLFDLSEAKEVLLMDLDQRIDLRNVNSFPSSLLIIGSYGANFPTRKMATQHAGSADPLAMKVNKALAAHIRARKVLFLVSCFYI